MIDRHLMEQMDNALSMRAGRGLATNEQALLAFLQYGAGAGARHVLTDGAYFLPEPVSWCGNLPSCWLNPKGGVFTVPYAGHSEFASCMGINDHLLNRAGWVHISDGLADDYYGRWTNAQRVVIERYGFSHNDATMYANSRLADDAKDARLRGLEFRQRDGWDWRTDVVREDYPDKDDVRLVRELVRENTIAY